MFFYFSEKDVIIEKNGEVYEKMESSVRSVSVEKEVITVSSEDKDKIMEAEITTKVTKEKDITITGEAYQGKKESFFFQLLVYVDFYFEYKMFTPLLRISKSG